MYSHRTVRISRRKLPHWVVDEGTYFVTFRLFDSLDRDLARLRGRKRVEEALDRGDGEAFLKRPEFGSLVFNAIRFFDGERYFLHSLSVMPNHVHVVVRTAAGWTLGKVVWSWKSFTAKKANALLGRRGQFWETEQYDRLICDEQELARANAYVAANPEKAGLKNWPWVAVFGVPFVAKYQSAPEARTTPGGITTAQ
jgi:REP element-mobilizing transposase RayT